MTSLLSAEIAAACNALGYFNGEKYLKDRYCLETIKELIRHLRRDKADHEARVLLGEAKVLQKDLIPLLIDHHEDKELFDILLRLLVNLTHPVLLLFGEEEPSDPRLRQLYLTILAHQQDYKKAFVDDSVLTVLSQRLAALLEIEWNERDEDCSLMIERILILIRNILQVPADLQEEQRGDNDASIHDQVLWACHTSNINAIFLYLASSENEQSYYMHILEILSQMLREQNASQLATAAAARSVEERRKDESELARIRQAEIEARQAKMKHFRGSRHSKFGGSYYVKDVKSISDRDLISSKPLQSLAAIDFDLNKTKVKTPKNRRPEVGEMIQRRSAYSVRLFLKEMCVEFLNGAYNALMFHVKESLVRNRGQENDETYYLWAMKFFMEFNRNYKFRIELVSETMSVQTFHWVQSQLDRCHEMLVMLKKNRKNWVKRQHQALKAYQELLMTLLAMDKCEDGSVRQSARVIKSNVFYVMEYREMCQSLLQSFDPAKLPMNYLRDLVETNHVFLRMLQHFCKAGHLVVQKRKRKSKPKKNKKKNEPKKQEVKKSNDELWEESVGEELSAVIQSEPTLPEELPIPFDPVSDATQDEQKMICIRRIQTHLKQRKFEDAIALLKSACEVWPELCSSEGGRDSADDQFIALKDIFLAELPPGPGGEKEEVTEVEPDMDQDGDNQSGPESEDDDDNDNFVEITEQDFNFNEFVNKFAHPRVVAACGLVIRDFNKPGVTAAQVHAAVKLLHRICVDCQKPAMAFQASMFRTFQRALRAQKKGGTEAVASKELSQFAAHIMQVFAKVARTNPHVYIETLFWKTSREAFEIVNGYDSYESTQTKGKGVRRGVWTEEQEDEIERLYQEYKPTLMTERGTVKEKELVDTIWENLIDNSSRSRQAVFNKLKEMELIGTRKVKWSEADLEELKDLYEQFKESDDILGNIEMRLSTSRSHVVIRKRLLDMGLATKQQLQAQKPQRQPKKKKDKKANRGRRDSSSSSDGDISRPSDVPEFDAPTAKTHSYSQQKTVNAIMAVIASGQSSALRWLMSALSEAAEERTSGDEEPVPLVPLSEDDANALDDPDFVHLLKSLGFSEPIEGQETYWRIPAELSLSQLNNQCEVLAKGLDGKLDSLEAAPSPTDEQSPRRPNRRACLFSDSEDSRPSSRQEKTKKKSKKAEKKKQKPAGSDDDMLEYLSDESKSLMMKAKKKTQSSKKPAQSEKLRICSAEFLDTSDSDCDSTKKSPAKTKKTNQVVNADSSGDEVPPVKTTTKKITTISVEDSDDNSSNKSKTINADSSEDEQSYSSNRNIINSDSGSDIEEVTKKSTASKKKRQQSVESSDGESQVGSAKKSSSAKKKIIRPVESSDDERMVIDEDNSSTVKKINHTIESSDEEPDVPRVSKKRALESSEEDEPGQVTNGHSATNGLDNDLSNGDAETRKRGRELSSDEEGIKSSTTKKRPQIDSDDEVST